MKYDDLASVPDGDAGFVGVDLLTDPLQVASGLGAAAENKRFRNRTCKTRGGMHSVPWAEQRGLTLPVDLPATFSERAGFGEIFGEFDFSDPNTGREFTLLAVMCGTWVIEANALPRMVLYPVEDAGVSEPVTMVQAFDVVLMGRGAFQDSLKFDPYDDTRWVYITEFAGERSTDEDNVYGDGTTPLPRSDEMAVFNGRVLVKYNRDEIAVSDVFDYTRYSPATARFRINNGDAGEIVRIFPFNQQQIVVFKERQVNLLGNFYGPLEDITNDELSSEFGCVAKKTVVQVGSDIWFLSYGGVFTVGQALENKLQGNSEPKSKAIEPLMNRVNWKAVSGAAAAYFDNRYYLAVPIDGATFNNALLVYDYINRAWSGVWTHRWMDVHGFAKIGSSRNRELFAVHGTALENAGTMMRFDSGLQDELLGVAVDIEDSFTSRGYAVEKMNSKTAVSLLLELETRNPTYSISAVLPGVGDEQLLLEDVTRSAVNYYRFGQVPWVPTNVNADHGTRGREDYRVELGGVSSMELTSASPTEALGVYVYFDTEPSGFSRWWFEAEDYWIRHRAGRWEIYDGPDDRVYYAFESEFKLPPVTGWELQAGGGAPAILVFSYNTTAGIFPVFNPDASQRVQQSVRCSARGSFVQVRVSNAAGRMEVHSIRSDALEGSRSLRLGA